MKALRLYQCSTCKLKRELLLEKDSPDLYNCVMTVGCLGKIKLLGQRKGTRPERYDVSIFTDFEARGFKAPSLAAAPAAAVISLESGVGVLTAGFVRRTVVGLNAIFEVPQGASDFAIIETQPAAVQLPDSVIILELIELGPLTNNEKRYVYSPTTTMLFAEGEDDSDLRRTLRIDPVNDQVSVLVDGVTLDPLDYVVTTDKVTFNPPLSSVSRVEVAVFRSPELTADNTLLLEFSALLRGDELRTQISWGGAIGSHTDLGLQRVSYICTNLSKIIPAKTYLVTRAYVKEQPNIEVELTRVPLMLAYKPYAYEDKQLNAYVKLSALQTTRCSLQRDEDGVLVLKAPISVLTASVVFNRDYLPFLVGDDVNSQATSLVNRPSVASVIGPV